MDRSTNPRRHPIARSSVPVAIPEDEWVDVRDAYGNLLARFHPPTNIMEFKARGERMAYAYMDEFRVAFWGFA